MKVVKFGGSLLASTQLEKVFNIVIKEDLCPSWSFLTIVRGHKSHRCLIKYRICQR